MISTPITTEGGSGPVPPAGPQGPSAYDVAVQNGFTGTVSQWLASLQGQTADPTALNAAVSRASVQADNAAGSATAAAGSAASAASALATLLGRIADAIASAIATATAAAAASATAAATSASNAAAALVTMADRLAAASGYATTAGNAATSATEQASAASTSASASAGSATSAATSATNAKSSETSASTSAAAAAQSARTAAGGGILPSGPFTVGHVMVAASPDGTTASDGGAPLALGTAAGTAAAGNDSRITGAVQKAANLSDLASPAAALQNLGGVSTAALAAATSEIAFNSADLRYLFLRVAALAGVQLGMLDGIIDAFNNTSDINTSASSGYTFSSSAGTIGATVTPGAPVQSTAYAVSTGANSSSNPASSAFDGNAGTYWASSQTGTSVNGVAAIGQDFGSGNTTALSTITLNQSVNAASSVTSVIGETTTDGTNWTSFGTFAVAFGQNTIQVPATVGAKRGFRLRANSALASGASWGVVDMTMTARGTVAAMVLQCTILSSGVASPSSARVFVQVDSTSATFTPNTDLLASFSRDGGATFTQGALAFVETLQDGTSLYDTGSFSVADQPAGSTMTYKFTTPTGKAIVLTGVGMQVRP